MALGDVVEVVRGIREGARVDLGAPWPVGGVDVDVIAQKWAGGLG